MAASASQAGLLAGAAAAAAVASATTNGVFNRAAAIDAAQGKKLSAEARLMSGLPDSSLPPLSNGGMSARGTSRGGSRLTTAGATRPGLHSSGGFSESGDFETEVDDLLGWAENIQDQHDTSPSHTAQIMHVR
jgi:hypothetical protein